MDNFAKIKCIVGIEDIEKNHITLTSNGQYIILGDYKNTEIMQKIVAKEWVMANAFNTSLFFNNTPLEQLNDYELDDFTDYLLARGELLDTDKFAPLVSDFKFVPMYRPRTDELLGYSCTAHLNLDLPSIYREYKLRNTDRTEMNISLLLQDDECDYIYSVLEGKDETMCDDSQTISYQTTFPDGRQMDIKICGADDGNIWTEAVLFDEQGKELCCTEPDEVFFDKWTLEYTEGNKTVVYNVDVIEDRTKGKKYKPAPDEEPEYEEIER